MKKTRFSEEQMVTILREADTKPVPDVAKKHGVSVQTIYSWRKPCGSLEPADVKRLRQLEQENGRLKKYGGEPRPGDRRPQGDHAKKMVGARVRRQQVAYTRSRGLSRPPRVRRALGGAVDHGLPVAAGGAGCPGAGRDASFGGAVPALRVSPDSDLPETRGARDEHRSHVSALAPSGVAGPAAAASVPVG